METLHIIKVGGAVINDTKLLDQLLTDLCKLNLRFLLVHGGGRAVNSWLQRLGIEVQMIDGRRITDAATLDLAVMNYAGLINKQIVTKMQQRGCNALGMSGADLNSIQSKKRTHTAIDYGYVGDVVKVNADAFCTLINADFTPVCCAITHDDHGQLLNTNADTIACELAIALAPFYKVQLWYGFEKPGVLTDVNDDNTLVSLLTEDLYTKMLDEGTIHTGMKPKLENCFSALKADVQHVYITNTNGLAELPKASGTKISLV